MPWLIPSGDQCDFLTKATGELLPGRGNAFHGLTFTHAIGRPLLGLVVLGRKGTQFVSTLGGGVFTL